MSPYFRHALVMAVHTVDSLTRLCKHELVYTRFANFAFETMGVVRIISGHDSFIQNGQIANIAAVGTVGTDRGSVR